MLTIPVLFEDTHLLVIDKPGGISVVEMEGWGGGRETVKDWVIKRYNLASFDNSNPGEFEQRCGIIHRLDKETSGVLLIAKDAHSFFFIKDLFQQRKVHKEYQAIVYGNVPDDRFSISAPLTRNKSTGVSYLVDELGRSSQTEFEVVGRYSNCGNKYTVLKVYPKTGRTHQIRVHLCALGYPVVNDIKYAGKVALKMPSGMFNRFMLHAKRVEFVDWDGNKRVFESKISLTNEQGGIHKDLFLW